MATTAAPIPGAENMTYPHETSIHRVTEYPVVKDTLSQAYSLVQSNAYSASAYSRIEALSQNLLALLTPRLPLDKVDGYANAGLDYVEKKFPVVKTETSVLVQKVRAPADNAAQIAKTYADGIHSRLSPVTDQLYARVAQGQETIQSLQARLSSAVGSLPRDKASATEAMNSIFREVESITTYLTTNAKAIPTHAQEAAKPVLDGLTEGLTHIREELGKPDVPLSQKASNVLTYTQSQVAPLLSSLRDMISKKKVEVEAEVPTVNGTK